MWVFFGIQKMQFTYINMYDLITRSFMYDDFVSFVVK